MTNDAVKDWPRKTLIHEDVLERFGTVEWGQPDAEGFYTPTITGPPMPDSGPGYALIRADDSPEVIERKISEAFAPVHAMREALKNDDDGMEGA